MALIKYSPERCDSLTKDLVACMVKVQELRELLDKNPNVVGRDGKARDFNLKQAEDFAKHELTSFIQTAIDKFTNAKAEFEKAAAAEAKALADAAIQKAHLAKKRK